MFKIGNDIVLISRIEKSIANPHFLESVFTPGEREYCRTTQSFAGIFAAKEALLKALGTGINRKLNTVEILHDAKGKPYFAALPNCDVSISHDGEYAFAVVILWE